MRRILLLGTAKQSSTRMPDKLTRPFGDTTLMELYVEKFRALQASEQFSEAVMAIPTTDTDLRLIAAGLPIYNERPRDRRCTSPRNEQLYYLKEYRSEYVLWLNACLPFLKVETVLEAVRRFQADGTIRSLTTVREAHNWFWTIYGKHPVNNVDSRCCSTRVCTPLYESTHAFHIFNRELMIQEGAYWMFSHSDPYLWEVRDPYECMDIHSGLDFLVAEAHYKRVQEEASK